MFMRIAITRVNYRALLGSRQVMKNFSEFFHPYPATESTPNGQYLVQAVWDNELETVQQALESGVDPNYRAKEVTYK